MTDIDPEEILLQDPLSKVTRQERSRLLVVSLIGTLVAKAGIVPTKISALGIELSSANQKMFLHSLSAVVLYFLIAFALYGWFDFLKSFTAAGLAIQRHIAALREAYPGDRFGFGRTFRIHFLVRALIFELALPMAFAVYALVVLRHAK
jgi:hypothetical protein